ncbi:hypothetical protein H0H93_015996 [Arthromyces matolae]|nr:hypothetical protein H0H93_015996 [Arthromyces matolae]
MLTRQLLRLRHRVATPKLGVRSLSTPPPARRGGNVASHLLAGVLGGATVIAGDTEVEFRSGYLWYHFSPIKPIVDATRRVKAYAENAKADLTGKVQEHILQALRRTSKAYVSVVPGADILVDVAFDSLGDVLETHRAEVDRIGAQALVEIQKAVEGTKDGMQAALEVMGILKTRLYEIQNLGGKGARDPLGPMFEKVPGEIQALADRLGPKSKQVIDSRMAQVQAILSPQLSTFTENVKGRASAWDMGKLFKRRSDDSDE